MATVPFSHPDAPKLTLLAKVLSNNFLHREIREKGGAYGSGAGQGGDGIFSFMSYRDPGSLGTLDAFLRAGAWAREGSAVTDAAVEEALLSVFSNVDSPVPPSRKGMGQFSSGVTHEQRQAFRADVCIYIF